MNKTQSPVAVINPAELHLNQSPLSNYGIDDSYHKREPYVRRCANCGKSEVGPQRFKTCSRCISIGVKRWEPLFHFYCSRECQKDHWQKHRIEHQLYEEKMFGRDTNNHQAVSQPASTKSPRSTQYDTKDNTKNTHCRILQRSVDRWVSRESHSSGPPSANICHYKSGKMKDMATDTSDETRTKNSAKNGSSTVKKKGNVNDHSPCDGFNSNARQQKLKSPAPKIIKPSTDEVDILVDKCNLKMGVAGSCVTPEAETKRLKEDTNAEKDKSIESISKQSAIKSSATINSSTPEMSSIQSSQNSQQNVTDSDSVRAGNLKTPANDKKPYTDAEFMVVTKSSTKSLYTGSSAKQRFALSFSQRDGGAVIRELKPSLDNPKSMQLLKRKMDEIFNRKFRSQAHSYIDRVENQMHQALDKYLGLIPSEKDSKKSQGSAASLPPPNDGDSVASPLSDDDYHDACTDLRKDSHSQMSSAKPSKNSKPGTKTVKTDCKTDIDKTKTDSDDGDVTETDEEKIQRIISHVNRMTYAKVKEPDDPNDLEEFCKVRAEARREEEYVSVKSNRTMTKKMSDKKHSTSAPEDCLSQRVSMKLLSDDQREKPENLVYVVPPYIHSKYPRRVDQYNGADPNDPFVEYSSSQSFVVQKPSRQRDVSYIGLLLSEKPNTVITQRYILLKNAAYDGRDIELGIKREIVDINEIGEPLYDDYLIRKIDMIKDSENLIDENVNSSTAERQIKPSNILSQLTSSTNLTSAISSHTDVYQGVSDTSVNEVITQPTASVTSDIADDCTGTAKDEVEDGCEPVSQVDSAVENEQKASDIPIVEESFVSKDDSVNMKLEGTGRFRVRNSSKEFGDIFSAEAEEQIANAPTLDLSKVFDIAIVCDETGIATDKTEIQSKSLTGDVESQAKKSSRPTTLFDAFDDPFLIMSAKVDSFPYHFRKEQGCIFIIKRWEDYYY